MQPTSMGSEQRANHNLPASKRMQRASMGSEQQGNHNFHALKRTRMSHIQQMHDDEDDENARNNDDPAFINEGTSINVIPQIGMPFNGGVMRARYRDYDLPQMTRDSNDGSNLPRLIQDEVSIITPQQDYNAVHNLNQDQTFAYNTIISAIERNDNVMFFVDGPRGIGKTYLYRALLATLRNKNHIVLAIATSGIVATILPGGRMAHSRFKIPLDPEKTPTCSISKQSDLAELIRRSSAIICDD
ncbi:hypothetical protein ACLB2K_045262 [Fragaria x ananassa]